MLRHVAGIDVAGKLRKVKMLSRWLKPMQTAVSEMLSKGDMQAHPLGIEPEFVDEGLQQKETC